MNQLSFDVVIIGGGPAGSVAAIASARSGASTLLVEQGAYLGGMLTRAGTGPQMSYHAGKLQVVTGIPEEIVCRMKENAFSPGHMEDFVGYTSSVTPFDPEGLKIILESMVCESGAQILYHTVFTGCEVRDGSIRSVRLFSKNGFFDVTAKVFLDCSADADLATDAGVGSVYGRESDHLAQPMTMNVRVSHVDREKVITYVKENCWDMLQTIPFDRLELIPRTGIQGAYSVMKKAREDGELHVPRHQVLCFECNNEGEFILNMSRVSMLSALDPFDLTKAEMEGRKQAFEIVAFMKRHIPGFENCRIISTGPNIGVRESRKINGKYKLAGLDLVKNTMFPDAIAMGGYPVDIHTPDSDYCTDGALFLKDGSWYSIPYRSLVTDEIDNLIVAGRCISATHEACAAVRVTPIVMAIGQAAGTAAAQSVSTGEKANSLNTDRLRDTLKAAGVFLEEYSE